MTAIEVNAKKMEIIEMLLNVSDEKIITKILSYVRKTNEAASAPPCQYTVAQMQQRIAKAEREIKNGQFIPHEEIKRKSMPL